MNCPRHEDQHGNEIPQQPAKGWDGATTVQLYQTGWLHCRSGAIQMEAVVSLPGLIMFTSWSSAASRSHQTALIWLADSLFSLISLFGRSSVIFFAFFLSFYFFDARWLSIKWSEQMFSDSQVRIDSTSKRQMQEEGIFITWLWGKLEVKAFGRG